MPLAPDTEQFADSIGLSAARYVVELLQKSNFVVPEYLSTAQAAAFTGFTVRAFENHRKEGIGPAASRIGQKFRYSVHDLRAWMEANKVEPKAVKP